MGVYRYFKEWRKNPQWSFSCCLALLLPLNDLQGEVSGLAATNVLKNQLKTGDMEMTTILIAPEDSGGADDKLEKETGCKHGKQGFDDTPVGRECNVRDGNLSSKCNQETQTELLTLFSTADFKTQEN